MIGRTRRAAAGWMLAATLLPLGAATTAAPAALAAPAAPAALAAPAAPAALAAPAAPAAPAQGLPGDDFTLEELDRLSMVPERSWGVSGVDPAETQTASLDVLVWDFAQSGNRMFVGGAFLNVQETRRSAPISQPFVAAFDVDSGDWIDSWTPTLDRAVYSLDVLPNGSLLVGGEFETVNGIPREGLVALDPVTGAIDSSFQGSVERPWSTNRAVVREVVVVGNQVYAAGNFSHLNGENGSRHRVYKAGRFTTSAGRIDTTWRPEVTGSGVWGLDVDPGRNEVHLAGFFSAVNGDASSGNFHTVNGSDGASAPGKIELQRNLPLRQPEIYDVTVGDGQLFAIGEQHIVQVLRPSDHEMIGFHSTGQRNDGFEWERGFAGGAYQVGERLGDIVFAGCHCTFSTRVFDGTELINHYSSFTGRRTPHRLVMAYRASTGQLIESFMADIHSPQDGTWAIAADTNDCLYVGGDFHVGGVDHGTPRWLGGFGRFCPTEQVERPAAASFIDAGSTWSYEDSGRDLGTAWARSGFNDDAWRTGQAEFGFGDGDEATTVRNGQLTYYFRNEFTHDGPNPASLRISIKADDGAVVYLNGTELVRDNMGQGTITASTPAPSWRGGADETFRDFIVPAGALVQGRNVLAVEVHNVWSGNNDLSFDLALDNSDQAAPVVEDTELVAPGSVWEYAHSGGGAAPTNWLDGLAPGAGQGRGSGPAELGFGDGEATALDPGQEAYYFTHSFDVNDLDGITELTLSMLIDDGAVAYLNGTEVVRFNMPDGPIRWNTRPVQWIGNADEVFRDYTVPANALVEGTNVLAVEVHNFWPGNPDLSFDATLERNAGG